ncbi:unnamed protein product [Caenorhabditis sp. 36 PRJEB53466]|nr:unnamed protein product [Caenorhabditis sp. 36 PRJEB53466]
MIRIYTSETWPSRIFWGVVVVTCVTFFMIQGGILLKFYYSHPTAMKIDELLLPHTFLPSISICPYGFKQNDYMFRIIMKGEKMIEVSQNDLNVSSREILIRDSYLCKDVIKSVSFGHSQKIDFCNMSRAPISDFGKCFTFDDWKKNPTSSITLELKNNFQKAFTAHIHSGLIDASKLSSHYWIKTGTHAKLSFSIQEKRLLSRSNWGKCKDNQNGYPYSQSECFEHCSMAGFSRGCDCQPFFDGTTQKHCIVEQLLNCTKFAQVECDCPVQCYSHDIHLRPLSSIKNMQNTTTVTFQLNSLRMKSHRQYKRFKQIDLMSYIGGVMGLFLGMSCITLIEVFIYLVKTVFGTLNGTRHKEFADKFMSDDSDSFRGSHEEIIITQKIKKNVDLSPLVEERLEEPTFSIENKRFSCIAPILDNPMNGRKLPPYRSNYVLKRNSTYLGACDF